MQASQLDSTRPSNKSLVKSSGRVLVPLLGIDCQFVSVEPERMASRPASRCAAAATATAAIASRKQRNRPDAKPRCSLMPSARYMVIAFVSHYRARPFIRSLPTARPPVRPVSLLACSRVFVSERLSDQTYSDHRFVCPACEQAVLSLALARAFFGFTKRHNQNAGAASA